MTNLARILRAENSKKTHKVMLVSKDFWLLKCWEIVIDYSANKHCESSFSLARGPQSKS